MVTIERLQSSAPCGRRWTIYRDILAQNLNTLDGQVGQLPIARAALDDPSLFEPLVQRLDCIAAVGVAQDLSELRARVFNPREPPPRTRPEIDTPRQAAGTRGMNVDGRDPSQRQPPAAYQWYFDNFIAPNFPGDDGAPITGVALFLRRFPLTAHYLTVIAGEFFNNLRETITRVNADRAVLSQLFFPRSDIREIYRIEASGADTHKGGKQVLFLTFGLANRADAGRGGIGRLVYKPSDVELDYRICGSTAPLADACNAANRPNPWAGQPSLVEIVNQHLGPDPLQRLPTYRILPCNPGSRLQEQDGILPIGQSYGYIEFLSSEPQRRADGLPSAATDAEFVAGSDWLCADGPQVTDFFRTWGRWLALARLFSWADLHEENVIAHRKRPYPIDFEISCTGPMTSLAGTQVVRGAGIGGLDGRVAFRLRVRPLFDGTGNMSFDPLNQINFDASPTMNRVAIRTGDNWVRPLSTPYLTAIVLGMREGYGIVTAHRAELLAWIETVTKCVARFTPYSTGQYTRALAVVAGSPEYARRRPPVPTGDAAADATNLANWRAVVDPVLEARGIGPHNQPAAQGSWPPNRPNRYLSAYQHDYRDFANHDVPAYYHRLDSPDLLNARGERVQVESAPPHNRTTYFPEPTINCVRDQVRDLNDEGIAGALRDAIVVICPAPAEREQLLPGILAALQPQGAQG